MTTRVDQPAYAADERALFAREIVGILLALAAILMFLALLSAQEESNWIGPLGALVAFQITFALGHYVAYALPTMIGLSAIHVLRAAQPPTLRDRGWLRGLGGLLMLVSTCSALTLMAPAEGETASRRAFELGGALGTWLAGSDGGLELRRLLGPAGAWVVFGGLSLIGLVLFTETMLRDIVGWLIAGVRRGWRWTVGLPWPGPLRKPVRVAMVVHGVCGGVRRVARLPLAVTRIPGWLRGVSFRPRLTPPRAMATSPIVELAPYRTRGQITAEAGAEKSDARRRSGVVLPRTPVGQSEPGGAPLAMERPVGPNFAPGSLPGESRVRERVAAQGELDLFPSDYQIPPLELLADPPDTMYVMSESEQAALSQRIEQTLAQFKIEVQVVEVMQGPVITRFALKVAPGVRVSRILSLDSELAMALKAQHVRILAPIPGQAAVGIEVPNRRANPVLLKELLVTDTFQKAKSPLAFALGKNIAGEPIVCDLAAMPHLLIAGTTGSGKSVCLNSIIASLLYRNKPDRVKFVMIDPKRVELSIYQAIPHLIAPVVSETRRAAAALSWCVEQMEGRYKRLAEIGVRNLDSYNALLAEAKPSQKIMGRGDLAYMPHIVIIIDELADLMMVARNEVEEYVIRLAQMARAVGLHLLIATQRPSVNVITGIIKANFPSRIAFQVSSKVDSRTILDMNGAEALMGRGDMLYSPGGSKPFRIQGAFVADAEVERLADYIREQEKARYEKEDFEARPTPAERAKAQIQELDDGESDGSDGSDESDESEGLDPAERTLRGGLPAAGLAGSAPLTPADMEMLSDEMLYDMALRLILESRKASVSYLQRRMKIGYARAGRIMDMMEENGIVGPYAGSKPRELLVDPADYQANMRNE